MDIQTSLRINAAFSLATGLLLVLVPGAVGGWLELSIDGWLRLFGVVLVGHAAVLSWATRQPTVAWWTKLNIAAIAPYPLLMIGLAATGLVDGALGQSLVVFDGAVVGLFAIVQRSMLRSESTSGHPVPA